MAKHILVLILLAISGAAMAQSEVVAKSECGNLFGAACRVALSTGINMSYYEVGNASAESLIFLHTDTTSAVEWAWTVEALLRSNPRLRVYAIDQRGAGTTEMPDTEMCRTNPNRCITPADLAADLLAFMNAKGITAATLVGHAMGAMPARIVAVEHPERVLRVIFSGIGEAHAAHATQARQSQAFHVLDALGWQHDAEIKRIAWPMGVLHLRPLDIDPDAVRHMTESWDISAVAAPEVVRCIAARSAMQSLASWGVIDPIPAPPMAIPELSRLTQPTLVLWGRADAIFDLKSQQRVIAQLGTAARAHTRMYFYWKQYGVTAAPATGNKHDATDIGHNLSWEAPEQLALDIDSFIRLGRPTADLYRTAGPNDVQHIVVEPGKGIVKSSHP